MKYQHVYIEWIDSETEAKDGWQEIEKHKPRADPKDYVKTAGFVVYEDKTFVSVALSIDELNNHYNGCIDIPKVSIKKRRKINGQTKS